MNAGRTEDGPGAALTRLNDHLARRHPAIAEEFAPHAVLSGSDLSDYSRGQAAIAAHFAKLFALPFTIHFHWSRIESGQDGDLGWIFAEGRAALRDDAGEESFAYHLSGTLQRLDGVWKWRVFHGSAPK